MNAWNVYLNGRYIDTVYYDKKYDNEDVRMSLINHDGYSHRITVRRKAK